VLRRTVAIALCALCACRAPLDGKLQEGDTAARQGRWEDARQAWSDAAALDPKSVSARVKLGVAFFELQRAPEAAAAWNEAVALDANAEEAVEGLARLELSAGDAGAAVERLQRVKVPTRAQFKVTLAQALLAKGEAAQALTSAQEAAVSLPQDPAVAYLVGSSQLALRRFADAQGTFEALQRQDPKSPLGSYGLARLAAAQSRQTDTLLHLAAARTAAGSGWNPARVAADPAFAFLNATPEFQALLK
jgi:tetratricopeptide (TPR) repeat protein